MTNDLVTLLVTMSREDAKTFIDDWERDREAPILSGGWMECPITVVEAIHQ